MPTAIGMHVLAISPDGAIFVNPIKLAVVCVLFGLWALFAQWVDKDTIEVNTFRIRWNLASILVGLVGMILLLLLPLFLAGVAAFSVLFAAFSIAYVIHRNGLVVEENRVLTAAHMRRILEGRRKEKKKQIEIRENVRIFNAQNKRVSIPDEEQERQQYAQAQDLLFKSLWRRASQFEILPAGQASKVRIDIDGIASEDEPLVRADGDSVLTFIKRVGGMNLEERRKPQKGKLICTIGEQRYELMVRTNGSTAGENLTIRVVGPERAFKVADLGFTDKQLAVVREIMSADRGLVLLTAPRGGGLSTTVYSFARSHDAFLENIQMLEYEREMEIENITQKLHEPGEEKTFAADLQRMARSDPDVIVLPELREKAAALIASQAAAKKQTVYVGLPFGDLFEAGAKWTALVGDPKLVARSLLAVVNQRLVRKLCPTCKTPYKPDAATLRKINMPADRVLYRPPEVQYDKRGNPIICQNCQGSGYVGRTAVFTMLVVDDDIRAVIEKGGDLGALRAAAAKKPGVGLQQMALQKVFEGITSIEEVVRATRPAPPAAARKPVAAARPDAKPASKPSASGGGGAGAAKQAKK